MSLKRKLQGLYSYTVAPLNLATTASVLGMQIRSHLQMQIIHVQHTTWLINKQISHMVRSSSNLGTDLLGYYSKHMWSVWKRE